MAPERAAAPSARGRKACRVLCLLALFLAAVPAMAAPRAVLFLSSAGTIRQAFHADAPELQRLIRRGGVAALVPGHERVNPIATLTANGYVRKNAPDGPPSRWLPNQLEPLGGLARLDYDAPATPDALGQTMREAGERCAVLVLAPRAVRGPVPLPYEADRVAAEDRVLARARRLWPTVPIIALHPFKAREHAAPNGAGSARALPWIAVSGMNGRLYSDTTRRAGVISILDVAPTLYRMAAGRSAPGTAGHPMWGDDAEDTRVRGGLPRHVADVVRWEDASQTLAVVALPLGAGVALAALIFILGAALLLSRRTARNARTARWLQSMLLALAVVPIGAALAAGGLPETVSVFWLLFLAASAVLYAVLAVVAGLVSDGAEDRTLARLQVFTGAAALFIAADVLKQGLALRLSPLANLYANGIRFYGIGNEYSSLFLAFALVAALATVQRAYPRRLGPGGLLALGAWLGGAPMLVGWPSAGANLGDMVTGFTAGGIAWTLCARRSGFRWAAVGPVLAAALGIGAVVWLEAHAPRATHVGAFLQSGGAGTRPLLAGKLAIAARMLVSPIALVCYAAAGLFLWLCRTRLRDTIRRLWARWPWAMAMVPAGVWGGAAGMLVNDSGVGVLGLVASVVIGAAVVLALEPAGLAVLSGGFAPRPPEAIE